ncbi:MAG: glycosyltransferase family 9 protein [Planctomycetota bacterium]|nr:glycosyltransferase family 9 protein [Planctomycetota bacterium]
MDRKTGAPIRKILCIRLRRLGDLITTTPAFRALRTAYPAARIDVVVNEGFEPALRGNPDVDHVIVLRAGFTPWLRFVVAARRMRYDLAVDFQGSPRSFWCVCGAGAARTAGWRKGRLRDWKYDVTADYPDPRAGIALAAALGAPDVDARPILHTTADDRDWARRCVDGPPGPVVALSVVARDARKSWPAEKFIGLARRLLAERGVRLILTYGPGERQQAAVLACHLDRCTVAGFESPAQAAALYARCDLWIGNDGGPKHMATAAACPLVMVVGSYWPSRAEHGDDREAWVRPVSPGPGYDVARVEIDPVFAAATRLLDQRARSRTVS